MSAGGFCARRRRNPSAGRCRHASASVSRVAGALGAAGHRPASTPASPTTAERRRRGARTACRPRRADRVRRRPRGASGLGRRGHLRPERLRARNPGLRRGQRLRDRRLRAGRGPEARQRDGVCLRPPEPQRREFRELGRIHDRRRQRADDRLPVEGRRRLRSDGSPRVRVRGFHRGCLPRNRRLHDDRCLRAAGRHPVHRAGRLRLREDVDAKGRLRPHARRIPTGFRPGRHAGFRADRTPVAVRLLPRPEPGPRGHGHRQLARGDARRLRGRRRLRRRGSVHGGLVHGRYLQAHSPESTGVHLRPSPVSHLEGRRGGASGARIHSCRSR